MLLNPTAVGGKGGHTPNRPSGRKGPATRTGSKGPPSRTNIGSRGSRGSSSSSDGAGNKKRRKPSYSRRNSFDRVGGRATAGGGDFMTKFLGNRNMYLRNVRLLDRPKREKRIDEARKTQDTRKKDAHMRRFAAIRSDQETSKSLGYLQKRSEHVYVYEAPSGGGGGGAGAHGAPIVAAGAGRRKHVRPANVVQRWGALQRQIKSTLTHAAQGGQEGMVAMEEEAVAEFERSTHDLAGEFNRVKTVRVKLEAELRLRKESLHGALKEYSLMLEEGFAEDNARESAAAAAGKGGAEDDDADAKRKKAALHDRVEDAARGASAFKSASCHQRGLELGAMLDKKKYELADSVEVGKMYGHMLARLNKAREERDRVVDLLQKRVKRIQRDHREARALHKRAVVQQGEAEETVAAMRRKIKELARERKKQARRLDALAAQQAKNQKRRESREERRLKIRQRVHENAPKLRMQRMKLQLESKEEQSTGIQKKMSFLHQRYKHLERAFLKIRVVTGVTDIGDIVYKFMTRDETVAGLLKQEETLKAVRLARLVDAEALAAELARVHAPAEEQRTRRQIFIMIDKLENDKLREDSQRDYWRHLFDKVKEIKAGMRLSLTQSMRCLCQCVYGDKTWKKVRELRDRAYQIRVQRKVLLTKYASLSTKSKSRRSMKRLGSQASLGGDAEDVAKVANDGTDCAAEAQSQLRGKQSQHVAKLDEKLAEIVGEVERERRLLQGQLGREYRAWERMALDALLEKLGKALEEALKRLVWKLDPVKRSYREMLEQQAAASARQRDSEFVARTATETFMTQAGADSGGLDDQFSVAGVFERMRQHLREKMAKMSSIFRDMDRTNDGSIDRDELGSCLMDLGFVASHEELEAVYSVLDKDNDGTINYKEFVKTLRDKNAGKDADAARSKELGAVLSREIMKIADAHARNGRITRGELSTYLSADAKFGGFCNWLFKGRRFARYDTDNTQSLELHELSDAVDVFMAESGLKMLSPEQLQQQRQQKAAADSKQAAEEEAAPSVYQSKLERRRSERLKKGAQSQNKIGDPLSPKPPPKLKHAKTAKELGAGGRRKSFRALAVTAKVTAAMTEEQFTIDENEVSRHSHLQVPVQQMGDDADRERAMQRSLTYHNMEQMRKAEAFRRDKRRGSVYSLQNPLIRSFYEKHAKALLEEFDPSRQQQKKEAAAAASGGAAGAGIAADSKYAQGRKGRKRRKSVVRIKDPSKARPKKNPLLLGMQGTDKPNTRVVSRKASQARLDADLEKRHVVDDFNADERFFYLFNAQDPEAVQREQDRLVEQQQRRAQRAADSAKRRRDKLQATRFGGAQSSGDEESDDFLSGPEDDGFGEVMGDFFFGAAMLEQGKQEAMRRAMPVKYRRLSAATRVDQVAEARRRARRERRARRRASISKGSGNSPEGRGGAGSPPGGAGNIDSRRQGYKVGVDGRRRTTTDRGAERRKRREGEQRAAGRRKGLRKGGAAKEKEGEGGEGGGEEADEEFESPRMKDRKERRAKRDRERKERRSTHASGGGRRKSMGDAYASAKDVRKAHGRVAPVAKRKSDATAERDNMADERRARHESSQREKQQGERELAESQRRKPKQANTSETRGTFFGTY